MNLLFFTEKFSFLLKVHFYCLHKLFFLPTKFMNVYFSEIFLFSFLETVLLFSFIYFLKRIFVGNFFE